MENSPPIKFYKGSQSSYDNLVLKDSNCFYYTSDENNLYLGDSLLSGNNGVGIATIEQTTSSSESGGINIWTVTLTDDREFIFTVYNGNNGASAYEVAIANGYEGTEEDWLESLKGTSETSLPDASECRDGTILATLDGEWVMLHMGLENITEEAF